MSTFDGFVKEFPKIRVDRFLRLPNCPSPTACFLSHVHTDHLVGLDAFQESLVYCSPATREMLLRLERYPHRLNFNKGIAEVVRRDYRHLHRLLKPIPLETPTRIQLSPTESVVVTLFDASHCLGAVSFLIEGDDGVAVIYTGDIRAESWLMQSWARHPQLLPYIPKPQGPGLRRLSAIYLDTTFAMSEDVYAEFAPKAQGIAELLSAVSKYPKDTVFYMHAWTFGYEDVWRALSSYLDSRIHLDRYRLGVYTSIGSNCGAGLESREAPLLCGRNVGNKTEPGILTRNEGVRIHSCEKGSNCRLEKEETSNGFVTIKPIVSRTRGRIVPEVGLGGGKGDLDQIRQIDITDVQAVAQLKVLCEKHIQAPEARRRALSRLEEHIRSGVVDVSMTGDDATDLKLSELVNMLAAADASSSLPSDARYSRQNQGLPREIDFPYARHSSYNELKELVELFRPKDIVPCTAPQPEDFDPARSMETFFGDCCVGEGFASAALNTAPHFTWDAQMQKLQNDRQGQLDTPIEKSSSINLETQPRSEEDDVIDNTNRGIHLQSSPPLPAQVAKHSNGGVDGSQGGVGHMLDDSQSGANKRPRVQDALDAAAAGEWHRVKLDCVARWDALSPIDESQEPDSWM